MCFRLIVRASKKAEKERDLQRSELIIIPALIFIFWLNSNSLRFYFPIHHQHHLPSSAASSSPNITSFFVAFSLHSVFSIEFCLAYDATKTACAHCLRARTKPIPGSNKSARMHIPKMRWIENYNLELHALAFYESKYVFVCSYLCIELLLFASWSIKCVLSFSLAFHFFCCSHFRTAFLAIAS